MIQTEDIQLNIEYYGKLTPLGWQYYRNPQCVLFTFTSLLTVGMSALVVVKVFQGYHMYISIALCLYIVYLLLSLGFSNPGFAFQNPPNELEVSQNLKYCTVCNISVRRRTHHCRICDVCIEGFDHHCIWIGKCIGNKNMGTFREFLCMVFGTLIYALVTALLNAT